MTTTRDEWGWATGGLEQLRRFVELLPVGAAFAEGERLLVNAAVERLTGYRVSDFTTVDSWFRLLFREDAERVRRMYDLDRVSGFPSSRTVELVRRDGERRLMEFRAREEGGVVVWTLHDVTERELSARALVESEQRLRALTEASTQMIWRATPDGVPVGAVSPFSALTGMPPEEARSAEAWFRYVHPDDRDRIREVWRSAVAGEAPFDVLHRVLGLDGEWHVMHNRAVPVRGADGAVREWVGALTDVTERARAEEALRESQARLEEAQRLGGIGSWSWDAATDSTTLSTQTWRILGVEPMEHAPGLEILGELIHRDDRALFQDRSFGALERREPYSMGEYRVELPSGRQRRLLIHGEWSYDEDGRPVGGFGTVQDVTEQRHLEEQLRQAQKMEAVGLMAGGVAHDFNNLLTVIGGSAQLILEQAAPDDPIREEAQEIERAAMRGAELTRQLLTFSRRQVVHPRPVNVAQLVQGAEGMLRRLLGEYIVLQTDLDHTLPPVYVDPGQLEQVLVNLVVNARDAMPAGGHIQITAARAVLDRAEAARHPDATAGEHVVLCVIDEGTGMSEQTKERIFDPFFTTKEKGKGTGLGLPTVFGIVRQAGGHLRVRTEPGAGSTFEVFLPHAPDREEVVSTPPPPASEEGGTETILLVEDEPLVRHMVRRALEGRGYTVLEAGSGTEAVELSTALDSPIHLLLTDVVLPELTGREVAEAMERLRPGIRVLYMSGYPEDTELRRLTSELGVPFIAKPFTLTALAAAVRGVLDGLP